MSVKDEILDRYPGAVCRRRVVGFGLRVVTVHEVIINGKRIAEATSARCAWQHARNVLGLWYTDPAERERKNREAEYKLFGSSPPPVVKR